MTEIEVAVTISYAGVEVCVDVCGLSSYSPDAVADVAAHAQRAFSAAVADLRAVGIIAVDDDDCD